MGNLKELVGDVVSILVSNDPFFPAKPEKAKFLIIKRPSDDSWKPNYFSPVTGHVEEKDIEELKKTYPLPWTNEKLYVKAGVRELREEVRRTPSLLTLWHIENYHDTETDYNVAVLSGHMCGAGTTPTRVLIPEIEKTEEAPNVCWKTIKEIQKLIKEDKFAGVKSFDVVVRYHKKFI